MNRAVARGDVLGERVLLTITVGLPPPRAQRGVSFISEHLRENPGSRVLIHCKSGRGRAATMALAWFVAQGHSPDTAVEWMQNKRSVIEPKVSEYSSLVEVSARAGVWPRGSFSSPGSLRPASRARADCQTVCSRRAGKRAREFLMQR